MKDGQRFCAERCLVERKRFFGAAVEEQIGFETHWQLLVSRAASPPVAKSLAHAAALKTHRTALIRIKKGVGAIAPTPVFRREIQVLKTRNYFSASISFSSLTASAANARMPSASFSVAIGSSLTRKRKLDSSIAILLT